ncbi:acetyltransferase family protein [Escherichia coli 2788150]|nr:acetyltransferase family protein [Escherichia coli 2788150]
MTASQHYSPQQIAAWAQIDESRWKEKLAKSQVRVAVINAKLVGFITCVEHYIDMLFVDPEYPRRGVASALLKPLIKSESELTVDASITAKPFFERYGFQTVKQQRVECRGEGFINFYMRYKQQH